MTTVETAEDEIPITNRELSFNQIDPRQITVGRIVGLIFATLFVTGAIFGLMVLWLTIGLGLVWYLAAGAGLVLTILLFWLAVVWPVWEYDRTSWKLSDAGLEIHRGVYWRHKISIPVARVQHADVSQGPLQRQYGLGKLTVHTAGTQNASIELDGISHIQAIELRNKIVSQRESDDVV